MTDTKEFPAPDELADDSDQDGWDRERDGRMSEYASDDNAVEADSYDETLDPEFEEVMNDSEVRPDA